MKELLQHTSFYFKVKGLEHTTSKVITLKVKSPEAIAALQNAREFAKLALPEARLQQGLDYLREMNLDASPVNTSPFLKWIMADVLKEEADEIAQAQVDVTLLKKELSQIALPFFRQNSNRVK